MDECDILLPSIIISIFTFIASMETKTKKATSRKSRVAKSANSPEPIAPSAEPLCRAVRYCGPTSHPSHHHAMIAADGAKHIWAAPIIASLAIILTASIAYTAVQAESKQASALHETELRGDYVRGIRDINKRLDTIEQAIQALQQVQVAE
jgi:hypothetical protein